MRARLALAGLVLCTSGGLAQAASGCTRASTEIDPRDNREIITLDGVPLRIRALMKDGTHGDSGVATSGHDGLAGGANFTQRVLSDCQTLETIQAGKRYYRQIDGYRIGKRLSRPNESR